MGWKIYDDFNEKELNRELWEVKIILPKENVRIETKNSELILDAISSTEGLGSIAGEYYLKRVGIWNSRYVGEAVRVIGKYNRIDGIEMSVKPSFNESFGEGNVHLRAVSPSYCYLIGVNFRYNMENILENADLFIHIWDKENGGYPRGGRIHHKDVFPESSEAIIGLQWNRNEFLYGINGRYVPYLLPFEEEERKIKEDSSLISNKGMEFFELKIDIYAKGRSSRIKAVIPWVKIREI
jgi:hypothetical protein